MVSGRAPSTIYYPPSAIHPFCGNARLASLARLRLASHTMSRWPHAVLFDFDGVLCNSEPLHFFAFQEVLAAEKISLSEAEYYNEMIGFDDKGAFKHIFAVKGRELDPKTFLRVMTAKGEVMMDLIRRRKFQPLAGVEE